MAVLMEGISVIVRWDSIHSRYSGGSRRFLAGVPRRTYCSDGEIARVGFTSPVDCEAYVQGLEAGGLRHLQDGRCQDIAVIDRRNLQDGRCRDIAVIGGRPATILEVEWLAFRPIPYKEGHVSVCWLCEGLLLSTLEMLGVGVVLRGASFTFATPPGWSFEESSSGQPATLVPVEEAKTRLRFLRVEGGFDVYLDEATGQESHVERTRR